MAVPIERPPALRSPFQAVLIALCLLLGAASALRSEQVLAVARSAIDGLAALEVVHPEPPDAADLPAMDPLLAHVVDPRPVPTVLPDARPRRATIRPFLYDARPGDTIFDVAARFGVSATTLLWNNELESPEDVPAGQKLNVLPVNGILHRVKPGETALDVTALYGVTLAELLDVNDIEDPYALQPGQLLVIVGGIVPAPTATAILEPLPTIGPPASAPAIPIWALPPAAATATAQALHVAAIATAIASPQSDLPTPAGATAFQREFILSLATAARESQRHTGIPASVTLAQAILESDWGTSRLAREAKNLFGIKAITRPGTAGVYRIAAWEVVRGANITSVEGFKAYETLADSIVDHGTWFHEQPRYARALAVRDDPRAFAQAINAAGYATDPAYASKLIRLMDRFDLYVYDLDKSEPASVESPRP